jgi:Xaa-Pro aminopeptidase
MAPKDTHMILTEVRKLMKDRRYVQEPLVAYIVPSCDAHNSEYLADCDGRREAVSGFSGSAGTAIITPTQALLWTDGRYHLQAVKEMDSNWSLMKDGLVDTPSQADWLCSLGSGSVGVDPMLMGATAWTSLADRLDSSGLQLVPVQTNLVDLAWAMDCAQPQPARPENTVFPLELEFTGRSWQDKVEEVRRKMVEKGAAVLILSALDDVAWMLNLRGSDIAFNPVFFSYAAVTEEEVVLFINPAQVTTKLRESLTTEDMGESVSVRDYSDIKDYISSSVLSTTGKVWLSDTASQGLVSLVPGNRRYLSVTPITVMKCIKNSVELAGFAASHARDSAALCQYFCWLEKALEQGEEVTEITGADRLELFRAEQEHFMGLSFPSISSVGPNGAIIHYRPSPGTCKPITTTEVYLLDSGAQYRDGTTDVTRTIHLGTPTTHQKECFTRVLKGMIGLATAVFPAKTKGHCLDSFARQFLWQVGLDYLHGTGHGVGAFLNVHEGPCGISWRVYPNDPGLQAGMILSDEPGYYEDGNFGIRIETLVKVVEAKTKFTMPSKNTFLTFEPVTVVPIQAKMIEADLLTKEEVEWLNSYHQTCRDRVGPILKEMGRVEAMQWLIRETQPIG